MKSHEFAEIWPMMGPEESAELAEDIRLNGLLEPIITFEGGILDGRNRFNACTVAEVEPRFEEFKGTRQAALAFVLSKNNSRRHLTPSQKAASAVSVEKIEKGLAKNRQRKSGGSNKGQAVGARLPQAEKGKAREKAAAKTGASPRYVQDAKKIAEEAPEIFEEVKNGTKTISQAKKEIPAFRKLKKKNGKQVESAKTIAKKAILMHLSPLARITQKLAEMNGGEGAVFKRCDKHLNEAISCLEAMGDGKK